MVCRVPNLPFFYLAYRAWSHWRALSGGKHIQFLLENKLIRPAPSPILDQIYQKLALPAPPQPEVKPAASEAEPEPQVSESVEEERVILQPTSSKQLAQALEFPDLETEIDRALWQVETSLRKAKGEQQQQQGQQQQSRQQSDANPSSPPSNAETRATNTSGTAETEETKKTK